jgi:D-glycero-alpha-D-manno-heptose-7-phosphate kinase
VIISKTPYRVSFFGGGTDYPSWYRAHGGAVLATTINKYCYINCRYLPPFFEHRIRLVYSKTEICQHAREIQHPAARAVLEYLAMDRGLEIHHDGDLPARSGIGSSSSFTVGLLHALYALKGCMPSKRQLATESIHIEQEVLRESVGSQDQVMAAYGGFNYVAFAQDGEVTVRPVTLPADRLAELERHLMLFFTGVNRTASGVASSYVHDLGAKERQLRRMREMVEEGLEILADRPLELFGELLHEAWCEKRSLSDKVTNGHVETIYEKALSAGAIGGKLLGAGGGGFLLLFVPPGRRRSVSAALHGLIDVPIAFERKGSEIIYFDREEDYEEEDYARMVRPIHPFKELEQCR